MPPPQDASGAPSTDHTSADTVAPLGTLIALWLRRRRLIVAVTVLGTMLAALVGLQIQPWYTASATVMIGPRPSKIVGIQAVLAGLPADAATVETQIRLMRSRDTLERVAHALKLEGDAGFALAGGDDHVAWRIASEWRYLLDWLPQDWLVATGVADERALAPDEPGVDVDRVVAALAEGLQVIRDGRSHVVSVRFTWNDPVQAARIANTTAEVYVDQQLAAKRVATTEASKWLWARIETLREELEGYEQAVAAYRAEHGLLDVGRASPEEVFDLRGQLVAAQAELAERQARLTLIGELRGQGGKFKSVPEVMDSPVVAELWRQETELMRIEAELGTVFGDNHPRMRSLSADRANLAAEMDLAVGGAVTRLENEAEVAARRIEALEAQLQLAKEEQADHQKAAVRLQELERQAEATRQMYQTLLQRYNETREQEQIVEPDAQVVATASVPRAPSSPGIQLFAAFGFTGSALLGTLLALLAERFDRGIRSGKQIEAALGLRCLASCPRLAGRVLKDGRAPHRYLLDRPLSAYAEALRSLQVALHARRGGDLPQVVQITSAAPGEGKTTLSLSFATSLAQCERKVLLLELDLRHPSLAEGHLGFDPADKPPGSGVFSDVLHDADTGVDLILVRERATHPQAVLMSEPLARLVAHLRNHYDHIVMTVRRS